MRTYKLSAALLAAGVFIFATGACTDLTEVVYDQITEENFNPTEGDLGSLLAPVYDGWDGLG